MGKILETTYHDTVENITSFYSDLVNNSFYTLNDKKPTIVTYYNINKDLSMLDPGSKLSYETLGPDSPIKFNKVEGMLVYGLQKIELNMENEEYGLEADKISGECYILPNTIIPLEGDYFVIEHIKSAKWLFIVTDVQVDTLANGSNAYKISYRLEHHDESMIEENIADNFKLIEKREGTNIIKVVRKEDLDTAKLIDGADVYLKRLFNDLFYNDKVQTFIYMDLYEFRVYDPYMIEFLIRNKILNDGEDSYIYVDHKIPTVKTFSIDYDRTFFRVFEKRNKDKLLSSLHETQLKEIKYYGSIFDSRFESYYETKYILPPVGYRGKCLDEQLLFDIAEHNLIDENDLMMNQDLPLWRNILVKYFYNENLTEAEINSIEDIHIGNAIQTFYTVPLLILVLEYYIELLLSDRDELKGAINEKE